MKRILFAISLMAATTASFAQVAKPMEDVNKVIDNTVDSLNKAMTARIQPGTSRKGNNPVLFLIGNSTMRNGTLGNGNNGQWGWGYYEHEFFDANKITVENQALGGMSSRTFYNRLWPDVRKGIKAGDWVIISIGHNDNGPYDSGRARASIPGIGKDSLNVTIKETGVKETVYTYGEYMRKYINDCKALGAHPILMSLTPRDAYDENDKIVRVNKTFGLWAKQVAEEQHVPFIDLNDISARKFEKFGKNKAERDAELYKHHFEFAANLENYLSEKQVEQVKDGMTFGVVPKTYQAHLEMIPSLKENEKLQILNWLKEAREFAIDAENSKAKHGWFGKYKGRINNWLTKRGYDLKAEREGWYKRIEAAKKK